MLNSHAYNSHIVAFIAGTFGSSITIILAMHATFWPAMVISLGAAITVIILLLSGIQQKKYIFAGVIFWIGLFGGFELPLGFHSEDYVLAVQPVVIFFGFLSGTFLLFKYLSGGIVSGVAEIFEFDKQFTAQIWDTLSIIGSLIVLVWFVITLAEKIMRYVGITVGTLTALLLNYIGYDYYVLVLGMQVEGVLLLLIGCLTIGFHTLESLHSLSNSTFLIAQRLN